MPKVDIKDFLGKAELLSSGIEVCRSSPGKHYWLIAQDVEDNELIRMESLLYPVTGNTGELSDEEFEKYDASIHERGYFEFLNLD